MNSLIKTSAGIVLSALMATASYGAKTVVIGEMQ